MQDAQDSMPSKLQVTNRDAASPVACPIGGEFRMSGY